MSNAEVDKAMDILSEVTQKVISDNQRANQQSNTKNTQQQTKKSSEKQKEISEYDNKEIFSSSTRRNFEEGLSNKYGEDWKAHIDLPDKEKNDYEFQEYANMVEEYDALEDMVSEDYSRDEMEMQQDPTVNFDEYIEERDANLQNAESEKYSLASDMSKVLEAGRLDVEMEQEKDLSIDSEIQPALEEHNQELNNFIDNEVVNEQDNTTNLTKAEVEGMLNDHFKKIEDLVNSYNDKNIDADTFKDKLRGLTNHIKASAKEKFHTVKQKTAKPVKDLKNYAKNRVNQFMNKFNDRLKQVSSNIDSKFNKEQSPAKEKIESTLKQNPQLLNEVALATQLHEVDRHLEQSNEKMNQINQINFDSPEEQEKIENAKAELSTHINSMQGEKERLEQNINKEDTLQKVNEQSEEQEQEEEQENKTVVEEEEKLTR